MESGEEGTFVGPAPLHAAVFFGIVESSQGVEVAPVGNPGSENVKLGRAVLAAGDVALTPEGPAAVAGDTASLGTHRDVVVDLASAVFQGEEVGDFEVEAVTLSELAGIHGEASA